MELKVDRRKLTEGCQLQSLEEHQCLGQPDPKLVGSQKVMEYLVLNIIANS